MNSSKNHPPKADGETENHGCKGVGIYMDNNLPFIVSGRVVKGYKRGRTFGFPTANIEILSPLDLKEGIYLGYARILPEKAKYSSLIFWGKPYLLRQVNGPRFEVHILQKDLELYGKMLEVSLVSFVRDNRVFFDNESLQRAMKDDLHLALSHFKNLTFGQRLSGFASKSKGEKC